MSEIRNQLQTLQGADILASQLSSVGGKVFTNAQDAQVDFLALVRWWSAIHAPTNGIPIPGSGKSATGTDANPVVLDPATNQTAYVTGLSATNTSGSADATITITVGGAQVFKQAVPAGETVTIVGAQQLQPFFLADGIDIQIIATGATPGDVAWVCAYSLAVQG